MRELVPLSNVIIPTGEKYYVFFNWNLECICTVFKHKIGINLIVEHIIVHSTMQLLLPPRQMPLRLRPLQGSSSSEMCWRLQECHPLPNHQSLLTQVHTRDRHLPAHKGEKKNVHSGSSYNDMKKQHQDIQHRKSNHG